MSNKKTNFVIEEIFKTEEKDLRLTTLQNIFVKIIRTCELVESTSFSDTNSRTKETTHE